MYLRVTGLARELKKVCGKFPKNGCKGEWYAIAKMTIENWNDTTESNRWCGISEQLQALALAKGPEKSLQEAIRKAK